MAKPLETKTVFNQRLLAWIMLALAALVILRLLPLLKSPISAYGYDYGFYLYAAAHAAGLKLGTALWGGYNSPLFYFGSLLHIPATILLNEIYLLATALLGLAWLWFFGAKRWQMGAWAILLTACSLLQAELYTMYLWKTVLALPFLVLGFKFLAEKKYWAWAACSAVILLTHRTTAIFYFGAIALYFVYWQIRAKKIYWLAGEAAAAIVAAVLLWPTLQPIYVNLIYNNNEYVRTGLFLEGRSRLLLLWPVLLLGLPGLYFHLKRGKNPLLAIFFGLSVVWVIFRLPFFHRIWIYIDLSLIGFAAYFLGQIDFSKKKLRTAAAILILFLVYRASDFIMAKQPLITPAETAEIKKFDQPGFVLAVSANDAPWLLGYTHDVRLGAPGLFEDPHTYQEWLDFWGGRGQQEFLSQYPRPLYLYQRDYQIQGQANSCLKPISPNFYEYSCD